MIDEIKREQNRKYYIKNKERIKNNIYKWREANPDKVKKYKDKWVKNNPDKKKESVKKWEQNNRKKINSRRRERMNTDLKYRLKTNVRNLINQKLRNKKINSSNLLHSLPYTIEELKTHLENQFENWMNWNNWGNKEGCWSIDHLVPDATFDYSTIYDNEFKLSWALENLRPLRHTENVTKSSKII